MNKQKLTRLELTFWDAWEEYGFGMADPPAYQYDIDGNLFDFAWPEHKLAIELNGMGPYHLNKGEVQRNAEKVIRAQVCGWQVLTYWTPMLGSKQKREDAINTVMFFMGDKSTECTDDD